MGFVVLHMEKAHGSDSGMTAYIERFIILKNADPIRTHFNRELVAYPEGVKDRSAAIQRRLEEAGLTRKIGSNKVKTLERENTVLHREVATRGNHRSSANRDTDLRADHSRQVLEMQQRHMTEIQTKEAEHKKEVSRLIRLVEKLCAWFPLVNDSRSSSRG